MSHEMHIPMDQSPTLEDQLAEMEGGEVRVEQSHNAGAGWAHTETDEATEARETFQRRTEGTKPFQSREAMEAAMLAENEDGSNRYQTDEAYRAAVDAKIAASVGSVDQLGDEIGFSPSTDTTSDEDTPEEDRRSALERAKIGEVEQDETSRRNPKGGFKNAEEMEDAVADPRYDRDPMYRQRVDQKLALTDWI